MCDLSAAMNRPIDFTSAGRLSCVREKGSHVTKMYDPYRLTFISDWDNCLLNICGIIIQAQFILIQH